MKRLLAVVLCLTMLAGFGSALAEEDAAALPETAKVEDIGIPTGETLAELKAEADEKWDEEDYAGASDSYAELAAQAGWLADIILSANKPFDSADPEAQAAFTADAMYEKVATAKALADEYIAMRKLALIRAGLGYYYEDDFESALPFLMEALRLIDISDQENWMLCAQAVLVIAGAVQAPAE